VVAAGGGDSGVPGELEDGDDAISADRRGFGFGLPDLRLPLGLASSARG
jgi:hypothetical protein